MKGRGVVAAVGLATLVAGGAALGAWLVERTLTAEATETLSALGVEADVVFSGRAATVTVSRGDATRVEELVHGVPGVSEVTVIPSPSSTQPTPSASPTPTQSATTNAASPSSQPPSSTPATPSATPEPTPTPEASPTPDNTPMPSPVIQFEGGSTRMVDGEGAEIAELAAWLRAHPGKVIQVVGHTDSGRTPEFRKALSEQRASQVVEALVAHGATREQLVVVGMADREPAASNDTREGRAANRRVTFVEQGER